MDIPAGQHARHASSDTDTEADLFLPPRRLWRYQVNKLIVAVLVAATFTGWLILNWSNVWMRLLAAGLLVVTAYVTAKSIVTDLRRARGRQIALRGERLVITQPTGQADVSLDAIAEIHWRNDTSANLGLWLMDSEAAALAHLDERFVQDQREALAFLHWLREKAGRTFTTRWP